MLIAWQITLYILSSTAFYIILAVGFGFILRGAKFFNLSFGGSFLVGGYTMFWFYRILLLSFPLALLLSSFCAGLYALLSYLLIFRPLLLRKAKSLVLLIASFGLLTATGATMGMVFGNQVNFIPRHLSDITTVNIFGGILNITETVFIVVACTVLIIFFLLFFYTNFGRAVRAVEDDREVAELVGISSHKIFLKIFFISGVLAGVGGIYEGLNSGLVPAAGITYILPTIVAVIIGGMWSFRGAILGAIILTILQQLTIFYIGGNWVQAVPFVVLIITLLIRPNGILQK